MTLTARSAGRLRRQRRGQMFFFVLILLIIAILLALLYWFSASSGYSQNARSAGRQKIDILGRTGGEAIGVGIGQQGAGRRVGPDGLGQRPPPPGAVPIPPQPPMGPRPQAPGAPAAPGGGAPGGGAPPPVPAGSGQVGPAPEPGFIASGAWVKQLQGLLRENLTAPTTKLIPLDGVELAQLGDQLRDRIQKQLKGTSSAVTKVTVKVSGLRRTLPFSQGAFSDANYYAEPLFEDGRGQDKTKDAPDVVPRDFTADIVVTFDITTRIAGQTVKREYTRFLDLRVTDCTPPARQFALFCYEPAHTEKYVKEDLNRGGYLAVLPNASARILIRGPLVVQVEDAATDAKDLGLGGQTRDKESISWPVKGSTEWGGFATIPGPRGIDLPYFSMTLSQLIERIGSLSFTSPPIRPTDRDTGGFEIPIPFIGSFNFPTVWLLGIAPDFRTKIIDTAGILGGSVGIYQPFAPRHQVAVAGTAGYYIGSVAAGQQKFSLTGLSQGMRDRLGAALTGSSPAADLISPFSGVILHRKGEEAGDVSAEAASVRLPLPKSDDKLLPLATGASELKGNDVLVTEPVYYPKTEKAGVPVTATSPQHPGDLGLFGMYGLCRFHRTIYWNFDLLQIITIIQVVSTLASIPTGGFSLTITVAMQGVKQAAVRFMENQAKKFFGFTVMLALMPMNYQVQSPQTPPDQWNPDAGAGKVSEYTIAPYGLYFDDGKPSLSGEVMQDLYLGALGAAFSLSLKGLARILSPLKQKAARMATFLRGENNIGRPMAGEPPLAGASERAAEGRAAAANEGAAGEGTQAAGTTPGAEVPGTAANAAAQAAAADLAKAKQALTETEALYKDAVARRIDADAAQLRANSAREAAERAGDTAARDAAIATKAAEDAKLVTAQEELLRYRQQVRDLKSQISTLETAAAGATPPPATGTTQTPPPAGTTTNPAGTTPDPANGSSPNLPAVVTQPPPPAVVDPKMVAPEPNAVKKFFPNQLNGYVAAGTTAMGRFWSFLTGNATLRATAVTAGQVVIPVMAINTIDHSYMRGMSEETRRQLGRAMSNGALGADGADGESAKNFPKGYLPPKYRAYALEANFRYPSMEKYIERFRAKGDANPSEVHIYINGIVRVADINYSHPEQTIVYHGRGIIAAQPRAAKPDEDPVFNVKAVRAADEKIDHLTLVYEPPAKDTERDSGIGQLQLGPEFGGSIYSAQGVRPAPGVHAVVIHGNLVCRHLNKQKIPDDAIVVIDYNLSQMTTDWKLDDWWAVTVSPRARRTASQ